MTTREYHHKGTKDTKRPLPPGWRWVRLGEVCEIIIGRTPSRDAAEYWNGDLPWVSISDLRGDVITQTREKITQVGAQASRSRLLPTGTLLYSFKLTLGKMAFTGVPMYTNEAIAALVPKSSDLDKQYLRYALAAVDPTSSTTHAVKGKTLNLDSLSALQFLFPPLDEQRAIVRQLERDMAEVARLRAQVERQLKAIAALPSAYLRDVFEGLEAQAWPRVRLGDAGVIGSGITLGRRFDKEETRIVPYLRVANVKDGYLDLSDVNSIAVPERDIEKCRLVLRYS